MPASTIGSILQRGFQSPLGRQSRNTEPLPGNIAVATEPDVLIWNALTSGTSTVAAASKATASFTPTANAFVVLTVVSAFATTPNTPTVTGNGLTWFLSSSQVFATSGTPTRKVSVFFASGASPSTGAATIDFAGQLQTAFIWSVNEFQNSDISAANGFNALLQNGITVGDSTANPAVTLGSALGTATAVLMVVADDVNSVSDTTPPSRFTESEELATAVTTAGLTVMYCLNPSGLTYTATATARNWATIAIEIKPTTKTQGVIVGAGLLDLNGITNGTLLSATNMATGQRGSAWGPFAFTPGFVTTATGITAATTTAVRRNPIRIGATTYATSNPNLDFLLDTAVSSPNIAVAAVNQNGGVNRRRELSFAFLITITNTDVSGSLYDILRVDYGSAGGKTAIFQWNPSLGLNIEFAGSATTHTTYFPIVSGTQYFIQFAEIINILL